MAVTSPDNIWTPDSTDDYSLTVDLAAMADTIQTALVAIPKNYRVGTNAQRQALTGADLYEGLKFYTTDTDFEWFYNGSAWRVDPGYIGRAAQTSSQNFTSTPTALPGMSVTVTVPATCTVRITAVTHTFSAGVGDVVVTRIRNGTTTLFDATDSANSSPTTSGTTKSHTVVYDWVIPSGGTYTVNVAMVMAVGGTGTASTSSAAPGFISVEGWRNV